MGTERTDSDIDIFKDTGGGLSWFVRRINYGLWKRSNGSNFAKEGDSYCGKESTYNVNKDENVRG